MPRYSQGAIVLEQESPWTQFLGGIGQGVSMGVQRKIKKADEADAMVKELMMSVTLGKAPLQAFGTKEFSDLSRTLGIDRHPDIQGLVARARAELPTEMTEVPPPAGGEIMAMPSVSMPNIPAAVQTPRAQISPNAEQVFDYIKGEDDKKVLAFDDLKRKQAQVITVDNMYTQEGIRAGRIKALPVQLREKRDIVRAAGLNPDTDATYSVDSENRMSITFKPIDPDKLTARQDKRSQKITGFETFAAAYQGKRTAYSLKVQSILSKDTITADDLALGDDDNPEVRKILLGAIAAIGGAKTTKERVTASIDQAQAAISSINKVIGSANHAIEASGDEADVGPDTTIARFLKPLKFEDVSGGLTVEQYRKKKDPPSGGKLISEIRNDYRPSSIQAGLPGSKSSSTESNKIKSAYDGIREVVQAALADRPGLTSEEVKSNIIGMKDSIMAEYGLSERGFSLLMAMANKVMG